MSETFYILDGDGETPIPAHSDTAEGVIRWGEWFEKESGPGGLRQTRDTETCGFRISTVFLGIAAYPHTGEPFLWETCIFSTTECVRPDDFESCVDPSLVRIFANHDIHQSRVVDRYRSHDEAVKGHHKFVELIQSQKPSSFKELEVALDQGE